MKHSRDNYIDLDADADNPICQTPKCTNICVISSYTRKVIAHCRSCAEEQAEYARERRKRIKKETEKKEKLIRALTLEQSNPNASAMGQSHAVCAIDCLDCLCDW